MKPILFNTEMVRAILDGRKTVTRRLVKDPPNNVHAGRCVLGAGLFDEATHMRVVAPSIKIGDILYVRETWHKYRVKKPQKAVPVDFAEVQYLYRADGEVANSDGSPFAWRPSIHMPKEAARIFLRVKDVRIERLQDITQDEAVKEGCTGVPCDCSNIDEHGCVDCFNTGWVEPPTIDFMWLWDSTIKPADLPAYGWEANPWVWVIEFERINKEEAMKC